MIPVFLNVAFLTLSMQGAPPECIDPATPLAQLAYSYDRWPTPRLKRSREGFDSFQRYLVSHDPSDYHKAELKYRQAADMDPLDRHTELVRAMLYALGPDLNYPDTEGYRHSMISSLALADEAAERLLTAALDRDSAQWLTAVAHTRMALASTEKGRAERAETSVRRALSADPASTTLNLALYDLLILQGRTEEALAHIKPFARNCIATRHALAEALILHRDTATGVHEYLNALREAEPVDLERFYDDIRVMASLRQLKEYRLLKPEERARWIRAFWERSAAASTRTIETRIVEQTQRARYADANFRSLKPRLTNDTRIPWIDDSMHITPWNGAGVLYVRHGPPQHIYEGHEFTHEYQGWVYEGHEKPMLFIVGRMAGSTAPFSLGAMGPTCGFNSWMGPIDFDQLNTRLRDGTKLNIRELYLVLGRYDERYSTYARLCMSTVNGRVRSMEFQDLRSELSLAQDSLRKRAGWSESSLPRFTSPIRIVAATYEFRSANGENEIDAITWIPSADLMTGTGAAQTLRYSISLVDSVTASARIDTTVVMPATLDPARAVQNVVTFRNLAPGVRSLRVTALEPADTLHGGTRVSTISVRGDRTPFALSDIVVAQTDARGALLRGGQSIAPLPGHAVHEGRAFRLFFELYGATKGERIDYTIAITSTRTKTVREQLGLGRRDERRLTLTEAAAKDSRGITTTDLDVAGDLAPGPYRIEIVAATPRGLKSTRTATLIVE